MKRLNLTIVTVLAVSLAASMIVIQPTPTEARSGVLPRATPSPIKRKIVRRTANLGDTATHEVGHKTRRKRSRKVKTANANSRYANQEVSYIKGRKKVLKSKNEVSIETLERKKQRRKRKN